MKEWAQLVSLAIAVLGFTIALLPRNYDEAVAPGQAPFRLYSWPKLTRFPVFWLGLVFFAYVTTQGLNPAWAYTTDNRSWWMEGIPHLDWLPTGVEAPFAIGGPWRMLVIYASVWLTVCAIWIGFTRRRSFQILFTVLATNAFLLACLGIAERGLKAEKIFWLWQPPASYFVSSFIYKNHAGAYFDILLSLCVGLAYWHYERSQRRLDKSSPSGLFAFFATAVALIVCFSYSRTATLLMFGFVTVLLVIFLWRYFSRQTSERRGPFIVFVLLCTMAAFISIGAKSLRIGIFIERMSELRKEFNEATPGFRELATQATWDMAKTKLYTGHGAGSFRFLFPIYQKHYPRIYEDNGLRFYWEHAHNDYIEGLAEFGLLGVLLLTAGLGYALVSVVRTKAWGNPLALSVLGGAALTLTHNTVDFNFYNPAILTTWCVLLFGTLRWVELEELAVRA